MIYNVSHRTDVPAYFWDWWVRRLQAGFFDVRNPKYPERVSRHILDPETVDLVSYISKDWRPPLEHDVPIEWVASRWPSWFTFTLNPYGRSLEPNVPSVNKRVETCAELSARVGRERVMWTYDPVCMTPDIDVTWHERRLEELFERLAPHVSSFGHNYVNLYPKVRANAPEVRRPTPEEQERLSTLMLKLCHEYGLSTRACPNSGLAKLGYPVGACRPFGEALKANGRERAPRTRPQTMRQCTVCGTIAHRDVGTYDTCPHLCSYCYANADQDAVRRTWTAYDPDSTMLCDRLVGDETIEVPDIVTYSIPKEIRR